MWTTWYSDHLVMVVTEAERGFAGEAREGCGCSFTSSAQRRFPIDLCAEAAETLAPPALGILSLRSTEGLQSEALGVSSGRAAQYPCDFG